ncbi:hypothetical protein ONZ45_g12952 [Pleurotus djamor]|nr:hypothetical protein ONZ45_g12952 [Pleurotus djamor]
MPVCEYCLRNDFPDMSAIHRHQAQAKPCKMKRDEAYRLVIRRASEAYSNPEQANIPQTTRYSNFPNDLGVEVAQPSDFIEHLEGDTIETFEEAPVPPPSMEEVSDDNEEAGCYIRDYPAHRQAGATFGEGLTSFQAIRDDQILQGGAVYGPFENDDDWELAKWLIKNVGHNQAEEFLKLPIISEKAKPSYQTKKQLLEKIDALPPGVTWKLEQMKMRGDLQDENGGERIEELELWYRDPVECIKELVGNPMFANVMRYAPEQVFQDYLGEKEVRNEMWTGRWWWRLQDLLPDGATVTPVILSSDKTRLSQFRGDKSAWPVYLTIGNISKEVRREPSSHATILIAYLPVGKFDIFTEPLKKVMRYRMFHRCMSIVLHGLVKAGQTGVHLVCADGKIRWMWPIFAAYVADYPEQCLVACCMENRCPLGNIAPESRGSGETCEPRDVKETIRLLEKVDSGNFEPDDRTKFNEKGLRNVFPPFWANLPHANVFEAFTPDLLHQLHKGVFKDHLVKWCTNLVGEKELDERFKAMPHFPGLRHFKNGISTVSQWTGKEHKAMEKIFLAMLTGVGDDRVLRVVRAILDFIYLASLHTHTSSTLDAMEEALSIFHAEKDVFIEYGARSPEHFNIPKIHSMQHYVDLIRLFGSADGFNTESPERLHIDYAKNAYRASNKKDYIIQMTRWLSRQEAVDRFSMYLEWTGGNGATSGHSSGRSLETDVIDDDELHDNDEDEDEGALYTARQREAGQPAYKVSRTHPRHLRNISAEKIMADHHAPELLSAFQKYISTRGSPLKAQSFDTFDLYKRLVIELPTIPYASRKDLKNEVRAVPPKQALGRRSPEPAHMDYALIRTGETNTRLQNPLLANLRIARVRVLFRLPPLFNLQSAHPLAYIEWFTPFSSSNPTTGLYQVSPSTRQHRAFGEIIEVDRIVRNCHLVPLFGRVKEPSWSSANVGEMCRVFQVNKYCDPHMFCLLQGIHGWKG